jgi:flavodoxin
MEDLADSDNILLRSLLMQCKKKSIRNNDCWNTLGKSTKLLKRYFVLFSIFLLMPSSSFADDVDMSNALIIYYSRTGITKLISETLQKQMNAQVIEIIDSKDRSGAWGYVKTAYDAFNDIHAQIKPEQVDLSPYSYIIVASPIWSWNLATPIHTLFEENSFEGKKLILITNANIHIMKYEKFGEDASFVKRFLKDYLREKRTKAVSEVKSSGGEFVGHYHIATKEIPDSQIVDETMKCFEYIKKIISNNK